MASRTPAMCTRLKQRAVIEFSTAENITPTEIYRRLQAVYGAEAVDRSTVNRWAIKSRNSEPCHLNISDKHRSGRPISASDDEYCSRVDNLIQSDHRITQQQIADALGISKERVGFIIQKLGYRKICARWVPRMLTEENKRQRKEACDLLERYRREGDECHFKIVTGDESWTRSLRL
ncbi:hypothetical protein QE152_g13798 [Popillia japonica]|uniref:Mos1 transposase HTH domain-containing protein n=1 Tax=Popillia japonica TaxID=7064 RepID=A0AAW1LBI6_POPJA